VRDFHVGKLWAYYVARGQKARVLEDEWDFSDS
jgi:hypothetical protein